MGAELISAVRAQYPTQFVMTRANVLIKNAATIQAITDGKDPHDIVALWEPGLSGFRARREKYLLYGYLPSDEVTESVIPKKVEKAK